MSSRRGRRALGVMAVAVVAIVAASIVYLHPTLTSKPAPRAGPINAIDHFISSAAHRQVFSGTVLIAQNGKILPEKGYGWFLGQFPVGGPYVRVIWHSGGIQGFVSVNLYYPDQEITLIVLSNLESFKWSLITQDVQTALVQQLI